MTVRHIEKGFSKQIYLVLRFSQIYLVDSLKCDAKIVTYIPTLIFPFIMKFMSTKMKKKRNEIRKGKRGKIALIPDAGKGWVRNKQVQDWM